MPMISVALNRGGWDWIMVRSCPNGSKYNGRWSGWQIGMEGIRANEARIR